MDLAWSLSVRHENVSFYSVFHNSTLLATNKKIFAYFSLDLKFELGIVLILSFSQPQARPGLELSRNQEFDS